MKKTLVSIFVLFALVSLFFAPMALADEEEALVEFEYTINDDGRTCTITQYLGTELDVVIPSEIDGYTVNAIGTYEYRGWQDRGAFQYTGINSVDIPYGVKTISSYAFYRCELTSISIPTSVEYIGSYAFADNMIESIDCSTFSSIEIGEAAFNKNKITSINGSPSSGCILNTKGTTVVSYGGVALDVTSLPEGVTVIGESAFARTGLNSIILPDTITEIGSYAFGTNNLTSITLPGSIKTIGSQAFAYNSLDTVAFSEGLEYIYALAFNNNNISKVTLPSSVIYIGNDIFYWNSLSSFNLPQNEYGWVKEDGTIFKSGAKVTINSRERDSYNTYYSMIPVTLDETMCSVDDNGDGTCSIGYYSDYGVNLTIPEKINGLTVTGINGGAFAGRKLTAITLPDTITYIGGGAFSDNYIAQVNGEPSNGLFYAKKADGTDDISTIVSYGGASKVMNFIPDTVEKIGTAAFSGCDLTSVSIPASIWYIGDYAFSYNYSLAKMNFSEGIRIIGENAFYASALTKVNLPDSLIYLGEDAFGSWEEIPNVTLPQSGNPWLIINKQAGITDEISNPEYDNNCAYAATADYSAIDNEKLFETEAYADGTCKITKVYVYNADLIIPSEINGNTVITIDNIYLSGNYIKSITLPDTLIYISTGALGSDWTGSPLKDLLPDTGEGWTEIDDYFIYYVTNKPVTADENDLKITDYGNGTCRIDEYLGIYTNIILPAYVSNLKVIDINCGNLYSKLSETGHSIYGVTFPGTEYGWTNGAAIYYEGGTFYGADALSPVIVYADEPRELTSADMTAEDNGDGTCTIIRYTGKFTSIIIPEAVDGLQVAAIGDSAFAEKGITDVVLNSTLESIGDGAFESNELTEIAFPESLKYVGSSAFKSNSLTEIAFPENLEFIGDLAFNDNVIETIDGDETDGLIYALDDNGKQDETTIISYCGSETRIDFIPESVKTIKADVFSNPDIKEIKLPYHSQGWIDDAGEIYIFEPSIQNTSSSYTVNSRFSFKNFMAAVWSKVSGFVLNELNNPVIVIIIASVIILPLLAWMLLKNIKSKKQLASEEITEEQYRKLKKRRLIIFIVIAVIIAALCLVLIISSSDLFQGRNDKDDEEDKQEEIEDTEETEAEEVELTDYDYEYDYTENVQFSNDIITWETQPANLAEIEGMIELERVILNADVPGDLSSLSNLTNLQDLSINLDYYGADEEAVITGDLSGLSDLINLRRLRIMSFSGSSESSITGDLSALSGLVNLESLVFFGAGDITGDLSSLSGLTNLKEIIIYDCSLISGDISSLSSLTQIKQLALNNCPRVSGDLSLIEDMKI